MIVSYNWSVDSEGEIPGPLVLGTYSDITPFLNSESQAARSEEYSLGLTDGGGSGTPQAYLGWVTNLEDGDEVTAGFYVWDNTPDVSPAGRIWGHYTNDVNDIDSYAGSASGNGTYSGAELWTYLEYTWTFEASTDRNGLVIEARTYSDLGDTIYIDDMTIWAPDHATIETPGGVYSPVPVPAALWLMITGILGFVGYKRKKN